MVMWRLLFTASLSRSASATRPGGENATLPIQLSPLIVDHNLSATVSGSTSGNRICQDYLDAFLNGTTDVRDECEGMVNAYQAAGCKNIHDPTLAFSAASQEGHSTRSTPAINDEHHRRVLFPAFLLWGEEEKDKRKPDAPGCSESHSQPPIRKSRYSLQKERREFTMHAIQGIPRRLISLFSAEKSSSQDKAAQSSASVDVPEVRRALELEQMTNEFPASSWHCCDFLHTYYSSHCASYEESRYPNTDWNLLSILSIIVVCGIMRGLVRKSHCTWLPEAGACILVGVFFGGIYTVWTLRNQEENGGGGVRDDQSSAPLGTKNDDFATLSAFSSSANPSSSSNFSYYDNLFFDDDVFLRILLPPIVFSAAVTINKKAFKKLLTPILMYAIGGTLLSSFLTGWMVHAFSSVNIATADLYEDYADNNVDKDTMSSSFVSLPKLESYMFGALISSVDPVAILSVLQSIGMTDTDALYVVIFGESLLNDGVSIVLFDVLVEYLEDPTYNAHSDQSLPSGIVLHVLWNFILVMVGSLVIGFGCAALASVYYWALEGYQHPAVEVALFFCWALIPYYISDVAGFSGIVSLVAAGFMMDVFIVGGTGILGLPFEMSLGADFGAPTLNLSSSNAHCGGGVDERGNYVNPSAFPSLDDPQDGGGDGGEAHYYAHDASLSYNDQSEGISIVQWHQRWNRQYNIFSNAGHLSTEARVNVKFVSEVLANLAETAIFAYLGFFLFGTNNAWNLSLIVTAILSVLLSRAVMIVGFGCVMFFGVTLRRKCGCVSFSSIRTRLLFSSSSPVGDMGSISSYNNNGDPQGTNPATQRKTSSWLEDVVSVRTQIILIVAGIRGAVSFALVENIPLYNVVTETGSRYKGELKAMTSSVILFTVFVCGGCTFSVVERLSKPKRQGAGTADPSFYHNDLLLSTDDTQSDGGLDESLLDRGREATSTL
jgi:NhaP-type Na+/H+ or K+/H+ antiporter